MINYVYLCKLIKKKNEFVGVVVVVVVVVDVVG